jgi:hypothetical protein
MLLLNRLCNLKLNTYELEVFLSRYCYYRWGQQVIVYINDGIVAPEDEFWVLNKSSFGIGTNPDPKDPTVLSPNTYTPVVQSLEWNIYNGDFQQSQKQEIINLINNISRADIGNSIIFDPVKYNFTPLGYVYQGSPLTLNNIAIKAIPPQYPYDIFGYKVNPL